jgi:transcriptional regulator with XRE-family HTH domain
MQTLTSTLGGRLRHARKAAGYKTAREFAQAQAIAPSTYSQYETGKRVFNAETIVRFCTALNINAHWLLFGVAGLEPHADTSWPLVKKDIQDMGIKESRINHYARGALLS